MSGATKVPSSLVLDGGLATQLEAYGYDTSGPLWSARALLDAPQLIARAQRDFADAGAECVATATYQATLGGLVQSGASQAAAERALAGSVAQARSALGTLALGPLAVGTRDRGAMPLDAGASSGHATPRQRILVAASVGPYGAALADGSEYRGDYEIDAAGLRRFHRQRLELLLEEGPDLVALETIPSATEACVLVELLDELGAGSRGIASWLSLSVRNSHELADGSGLDAPWLEDLLHCAELAAVGVNCLAPRLVEPTLQVLRGLTDKPLVAYPNSGEVWRGGAWHVGNETLAGSASEWAAPARRWWERGARWIGGCCRTGPAHIGALASEVATLRQVRAQAR